MSMDLTQAYRALDPLASLEPGSVHYVQRPDNPMDRVGVDLKLSDRSRHYLLSGHRGTGKTTELRRLAHALQGERELVFVDVGEHVDSSSFDSSQVIEKALGIEVEIDSNLRTILDHLRRVSLDPRGGLPPVVIIDGLERLARDKDVVRALNDPIPIHTWPVSVICTIPLSVYLSSQFGEHARNFDRSVFLPGITVVDRTGLPNDLGIEALSSIIRRRTGEHIFTPGAFPDLVFQSAGIHRELLQLAQRACVVAASEGASQITHEHVSAAIREQRNEYSVVLRTGDFPILRTLTSSKDLAGGPDTSRLIRNQLIVAYGNGTTWFDVHPIVRPLVEGKVSEP